MTTIISDGNYLIADKQESCTIKNSHNTDDGKPKEIVVTSFDCNKIIVPPKPHVFWSKIDKKDKTIAALAFSGQSNFAFDCFKKMQRGISIYTYMEAVADHVKDANQALVLCTDGTTERMGIKYRESFYYRGHNGEINGSGSGFGTIIQALHLMDRTKVSAMDAFMLAVSCDPHSCNRFDVYELKTKKLLKDLRFSELGLSRVINRMQSHIDLSKLLKK